ncbi:hypothetical protein E2320_014373 [Naja naja]|nr:hypothetical protein E2320_014373 [Naja naja]
MLRELLLRRTTERPSESNLPKAPSRTRPEEGAAPWRQSRSRISRRKSRQAEERDPQLPSSWRVEDLLGGGAAWRPEREQPHLRRAGPKASPEGPGDDSRRAKQH